MLPISVTELTSQPEMSALNADAWENIHPIFVTELTFQLEMSALNADAWENMPPISVTELTSQFGISSVPAGPQSAVAQHVTPVASTCRQLCTAVFSWLPLLVNGAASAPMINHPVMKKSRASIKSRELGGIPRIPRVLEAAIGLVWLTSCSKLRSR